MQGEPVYELSYKGKEVIKPSKLGLELKNDPGLMKGFTLADIKPSAFDETWEPVWGDIEKCPGRLHSGVKAPQMDDNFSYSIEEHFERQIWHYVRRL